MSALIEEAARQLDAAVDKSRAALAAEAYARCEFVSLELLALAELDPTIVSFTIETGWEYDDESSYFHTVNLWPERSGDVAPELEDSISDALMEVNHDLDEASVALFGGDGALITVAELRERKEVTA